MKDDLTTGVKRVLIVFLFCFLALITYIAYFTTFKAPELADNSQNKRLWAKRNEVLRGTIYDRNGKELTKSERVDTLTQKRTYVDGPLFAHALGYVNPKYGITGLENKYDEQLMNTKNTFFNIKEAIKEFDIKKAFNNDQDKNKVGNSLKTSIDYKIQKVAYDAIGNNKGAAVVLNPKTGEVLAMVSKPTYDPNNLEDVYTKINNKEITGEDSPLINRVTQGLYPPGSTFKVVTATSALENMQGIKERTFQDNGRIEFNSKQSLSNYGGEANGPIKFADAFRKSSNVVFGTLAMELGNDKLKETAEKFYFNKSISADGISIENSIFPKLQANEKGNIAQSGIGQSSISASPMEMALVASTVANDGVMMEPKIVNEILNFNGEFISKIDSKPLNTVMKKDTAMTLKTYMKSVIDNGTVNSSLFSGLNAAGKTGTADHMDKNGQPAKPHSWFIGFAPYDNPQISIAVIIENGGVGGGAAAQAASTIMRSASGK